MIKRVLLSCLLASSFAYGCNTPQEEADYIVGELFKIAGKTMEEMNPLLVWLDDISTVDNLRSKKVDIGLSLKRIRKEEFAVPLRKALIPIAIKLMCLQEINKENPVLDVEEIKAQIDALIYPQDEELITESLKVLNKDKTLATEMAQVVYKGAL
jgi:hypothetical protein